MMFFSSFLLLFATIFSLVAAAATPTHQHLSARVPPKLNYNILPPNAPAIRDWVNLFRRLLPQGQPADTAEIRRQYMWTPNRRYPNSVFYVNQPRVNGMDNDNPNWGTTRALQLRQLLQEQRRQREPNAEALMDIVSIADQAYDTREAFGLTDRNTDTPSEIRRAALSLNQERDWFRWTSAAFAEMVTGDVFLVVEEGNNAIGTDSIWATHELPAIQRSEEVTRIFEVRPANVGEVLAGTADLNLIEYRDPNALQRHPTHGDPNPTPAPAPGPPDHDEFKRGPNKITVKIDEKKALAARTSIDIDLSDARDVHPPAPIPDPPSKPAPPYKEGTCWIHLKEWRNPNVDDPNWAFAIEVSMYDDHTAPDPGNQIGYVQRTNVNPSSALEMASKLEDNLRISPVLEVQSVIPIQWNDYIQFDLADQHWRSSDADRCSVGGYDDGMKREMDCHFGCLYGGKPSSDGSGPPGAAAAKAVVAGNAAVNAAVENSSSGGTSSEDDKWSPIIIGLLIANLVIVLSLVVLNIAGRLRGTPRPTKPRSLSLSHTGTTAYKSVHKKDHDDDMDEVASLKNSFASH
ncbi:hypothetical protein DL96DRAFT_1762161 [Flagelloscypha sp. PMI_526]|nr:hypothetical protein DL96DRAFT_1762161 [Flagelloscypha sp. PMI_526]